MAVHSKVKIYVHMVWGTLNHERILHREFRLKLFNHFVERANELDIVICKLNIQPEHVHNAFNLPSTKTVADVAQAFKGESSAWINDNNFLKGKFRWQRGYGAFSVSASQLDVVERYVKNQDEHHKRQTFAEEYKQWAIQYGVWDDEY